jgi:ABC-2 type transport system permease protein
MNNILAIANKELRSYFTSPLAYVVLGVFALMFGWFFYAVLLVFDRQSLQMAGMGAPVNVNEQLISPALQNTAVILLFMVPMITMRTYAEEKRSGTMELLLTAPLTDLQIILGKFLGAMTLYVAMLALTLVHIGTLFMLGNPEWLPVASGYLGLLLMGGCFVAVGLFVSSMTRNQIVAGMFTFVIFLMLWVIDWVAGFGGPTTQAVLTYLSFTGHLSDFVRGVIDTKHVVYYVSIIAFGLYLTARSVDTERWRG